MGVKVDEVLKRIFSLEDKISELSDGFMNYLENESYFLKLNSDVVERENFLLIKIDVPGIDKEDIKIFCKDNNLIVKGIKKKEYNEEKVNFIIAERRFGSFYNVYPVLPDYDLNNMKVELKNGVLRIEIPKKTEISVIKKIEIE